MTKWTITLLLSVMFSGSFHLVIAFPQPKTSVGTFQTIPLTTRTDDPKEKAFLLLNSKCNVCHRKQNPFKVFTRKNMNKNARKIYQQVFVKRRMPKGDKVRLTEENYQTLTNWLQTQNIN